MKVRFQADADLNEIIVKVEDLILIWTASEAEEWTNRIYSLPL